MVDSTLGDIMRLARQQLGDERTDQILKEAGERFEKEFRQDDAAYTQRAYPSFGASTTTDDILNSIAKMRLGSSFGSSASLTNNFNPEYQTPTAPVGYGRKVADARQDVLPENITVAVARIGDLMRENLTTGQAIIALASALGEVIALHAHPGVSAEEPDLTRFEAVLAHATCTAVEYANEFRDHYEESGLYKLRYK